jgi:hypothetical protein
MGMMTLFRVLKPEVYDQLMERKAEEARKGFSHGTSHDQHNHGGGR